MIKAILARIKAHNVVIMAAGTAFYATLALVPTLIALVSVYALATDPAEIADQIDRLAANMDPETAKLVKTQLETAVSEAKGSGVVALIIGIVLALFSASGAVQKLMLSINLAYGAIESRKGWKVRGLAYLFTVGAIVGVVIIALLLGALPKIMDEVGLSGPTQVLLNVLRFPVLGVVMAVGFTMLYRLGPDRDPKTSWKNLGAVVGTLAFLVFCGLFVLYFRFAGGMPASYGILGSIAAIIIFFQLGAIAVIVGAEVNAAIERSATLPLDQPVQALGLPVATSGAAEPIGLGKAVAGLAAIFVLGRSGS
ncbi:MAG: membrane protein [Acidimicrobiales bacterium]|jgi:membrane protein